MSLAEPTEPERLPFEVEFGGGAAALFRGPDRAGLRLPVPHLGGMPAERLFGEVAPAGEKEGCPLFFGDGLLVGIALEPGAGDMGEAARRLYRRILGAAAGRTLYRIWNFVPQINRLRRGLENYRAFSLGRSQAFEEAFGPAFRRRLPAASGVGCDGEELAAIFVAGRGEARRFENPEQVPAYDYPEEHGPRPPSFSRAVTAATPGRRLTFISGTAAIKGHATVSPGALEPQIECTLHNLRLIFRAAGHELDAPDGAKRHFKVYLRRRGDLARVRKHLTRHCFRRDDAVVWLQAALCRAELKIEIEATLEDSS